MITLAHAYESDVIFMFFKDLSNKNKFKKLRPKMIKIALKGSCLNYRKRGSASFIVREVRSVRERDTETERETKVTSP